VFPGGSRSSPDEPADLVEVGAETSRHACKALEGAAGQAALGTQSPKRRHGTDSA
jgi:hypothetical protein